VLHFLHVVVVFLASDRVITIQIVVKVDDLWEGYTVVDFHSLKCRVVKGESVQDDCEDFWPLRKLNSFFSVLLALTALTEILVIASQLFRLDVILEGHLNRAIKDSRAKLVPDGQSQVKERVRPRRLLSTIEAFDVGLACTLEQFGQR